MASDTLTSILQNELTNIQLTLDKVSSLGTAFDPGHVYAQTTNVLAAYASQLGNAKETFKVNSDLFPELAYSISGSQIALSGFLGGHVEVSSPQNAERTARVFDEMNSILTMFRNSSIKIAHILTLQKEVLEEQRHISQAEATTVSNHIAHLRQYNKVKDIGQNLIGLVVENRGVPVASVYESGEFGVSSED